MKATAPPLHLLNTFAVAGRLLSFKKAAYELNISPPAISQQIRLLESHVGESLFQREAGGVQLTPLGEQFYALASELLAHYHQGYRRLYQAHETPVIRISTLSQIVADILIPALPGFQQRYPQIDLRLETCEELIDFDSDWIAGAIRVGHGDWPGLKSIKLCDLTVSAVVSPQMYAAQGPVTLQTLRQLTLIHSRTYTNDWQRAGRLLEVDLAHNKQLYFNNYSAALAAAASGIGVALAMFPLCNPLIDNGRLMQLTEQQVSISEACYFVYPARLADNVHLTQIQAWLIELFDALAQPS